MQVQDVEKVSRSEGELVTLAGLVEKSGVPRPSCQYYIALGLIPNVGKNERGWTLYDDEGIKAAKLARELTTSGFLTSEIKEIYNRLSIDTVENKFLSIPIEDFREWLKSEDISLKHELTGSQQKKDL